MGIWVDTDMGFDDLWALLILRAFGLEVDGVSLVAGNTPLAQVVKNALGAKRAFDFSWSLSQGANKPLLRAPETAQSILGPRGMPSRGRHLPEVDFTATELPPATDALLTWLTVPQTRHDVLALGPLTNLAILADHHRMAFNTISTITWMGGASGPGNHSPHAEFNAMADAEAVAAVINTSVPVQFVDLEICRQVTFSSEDIPPHLTPLIADLLRGYLDIAVTRGRKRMAIYDPLAALALVDSQALCFEPRHVSIDIGNSPTYGKTHFSIDTTASTTLAVNVALQSAARCLEQLKDVVANDNF